MLQQSTKSASGTIGVILIAAGVLVALGQVFDFSVGQIAWPLYIIVPGAMLLFISFFDEAIGKVLAPIGMMITVTGCVLAYQSWTGHYQSWAYAWILTSPFAIGAGLAMHGIRYDDNYLLKVGRTIATVSIAFFLAAAAVFELVFNISGLGSSVDIPWGIMLPVVLIVAGAAALIHQSRQH